jgi:hypothetical protein
MKRLSFIVILLLLLVNMIGMITPTEVNAKDPPVFDAEAIEKDPFKAQVTKADLIALGTITQQKYDIQTEIICADNEFTRKGAYTVFTLSVEKVIKGNPDTKSASIKVEGGPINGMYQLPTGRYFRISDHVLVGLIRQKGNVYAASASHPSTEIYTGQHNPQDAGQITILGHWDYYGRDGLITRARCYLISPAMASI